MSKRCENLPRYAKSGQLYPKNFTAPCQEGQHRTQHRAFRVKDDVEDLPCTSQKQVCLRPLHLAARSSKQLLKLGGEGEPSSELSPAWGGSSKDEEREVLRCQC